MTALLILKQKMKEFYGEHDTWILPVLKFLMAFVVFKGINSTLGFMNKLDNIFLVLILSLLCSVLPVNAMTVLGCVLIVGHCYAVGVEVAGFSLLLILLLMILFLRFTSKDNVALVLTPVSFALRIPASVPIGCGLLRGPSSAVPAGCGIVLYYFMRMVKEKASVLQGKETEAIQKLQILLDGLIKNQEMWMTIIAFAAVILIVYLIRRSSFDYSWRIATVTGAVIYIVFMLFGNMFMNISANMGAVIVGAVFSIIIGLILEFFVLGVDYSRSEVTQFEDDEYVYYVKAVPKSLVSQTKKSVKRFSSTRHNEEADEETSDFEELADQEAAPVEPVSEEDFDFEKQLEESLKNL